VVYSLNHDIMASFALDSDLKFPNADTEPCENV
jgi:hypothetical protein